MLFRSNTTIAFLRKYTNHLALIRRKKERGEVRDLCEELHVKTPSIETPIKTLSGGNIQKVVVAKWLMGDSEVYFFDEPTVGIDVKGKSEIYALIHELAENGKAVVVTSSEVEEAIAISDRIAVLFNGRIVHQCFSCDANREAIIYLTMGGKENA